MPVCARPLAGRDDHRRVEVSLLVADVRRPTTVPGMSNRSPFRWLTDPSRDARLRFARDPAATGDAGHDVSHDAGFHAVEFSRSRFCAPVAAVSGLQVAGQQVTVSVADVPYCRMPREGLAWLGWNCVVTVDDGTNVVVARRAEQLSGGGLWVATPNEGAQPVDVPDAACFDAGAVVARAVFEELAVLRPVEVRRQVTSTVGVFSLGPSLGVLLHVSAETAGVTSAGVLESHPSAPDAWEGQRATVPLAPASLDELAPASGWVPSALPSLYAVAARARVSRDR